MVTDAQEDGATGYRLFILDENGRSTSIPIVITARDDKAATHEAETMTTGKSAELWVGARLVARFTAKLTGQFAQQDMGALLAFS